MNYCDVIKRQPRMMQRQAIDRAATITPRQCGRKFGRILAALSKKTAATWTKNDTKHEF